MQLAYLSIDYTMQLLKMNRLLLENSLTAVSRKKPNALRPGLQIFQPGSSNRLAKVISYGRNFIKTVFCIIVLYCSVLFTLIAVVSNFDAICIRIF